MVEWVEEMFMATMIAVEAPRWPRCFVLGKKRFTAISRSWLQTCSKKPTASGANNSEAGANPTLFQHRGVQLFCQALNFIETDKTVV